MEGDAGPLGVSSYFDEALFARELATIFQTHPRYVGSARAVPEVGDYYALPQEAEGRVLLRTERGVELLSNVCRHRQAVILRGRGSLLHNDVASGGNIVCPIHRWTYSPSGTLLGAPHFADDPCLHLKNYPVEDWNGLCFERGTDLQRGAAQDLAGLAQAADLDFSGYVLDRVELHECRYNWKTFIEVYLEDYHVAPFHPGLGRMVDCGALRWEMWPRASVQTVGAAALRPANAGSAVYRRWQQALQAVCGPDRGPYGAIWLTYYPHIMVEWYPKTLVVSTVHPVAPQRTRNVVEFYYPEEIAAFEREFVEAQQAAYMETCVEDDEIAERMDAGRRALWLRGDDEVGPYQRPMEDGMRHFHEWYRATMRAYPP